MRELIPSIHSQVYTKPITKRGAGADGRRNTANTTFTTELTPCHHWWMKLKTGMSRLGDPVGMPRDFIDQSMVKLTLGSRSGYLSPPVTYSQKSE